MINDKKEEKTKKPDILRGVEGGQQRMEGWEDLTTDQEKEITNEWQERTRRRDKRKEGAGRLMREMQEHRKRWIAGGRTGHERVEEALRRKRRRTVGKI